MLQGKFVMLEGDLDAKQTAKRVLERQWQTLFNEIVDIHREIIKILSKITKDHHRGSQSDPAAAAKIYH